jgi:hypothetical protein
MSLLNGALSGQLADVGASRLIAESGMWRGIKIFYILFFILFYLYNKMISLLIIFLSARAVAAASNGLLACAKDVAEESALDPTGQHKLLNVANLGTIPQASSFPKNNH